MQQPPSDDPAGQDSVTRSDANQTHEEILEYWTKQRMAEAKPRELRLPAKGPRLKQGDADTNHSGPEDPEPLTRDPDVTH